MRACVRAHTHTHTHTHTHSHTHSLINTSSVKEMPVCFETGLKKSKLLSGTDEKYSTIAMMQ